MEKEKSSLQDNVLGTRTTFKVVNLMQGHHMLIIGILEIQGIPVDIEHLLRSIGQFYSQSWHLKAQKVIILYDVLIDSNVEKM